MSTNTLVGSFASPKLQSHSVSSSITSVPPAHLSNRDSGRDSDLMLSSGTSTPRRKSPPALKLQPSDAEFHNHRVCPSHRNRQPLASTTTMRRTRRLGRLGRLGRLDLPASNQTFTYPRHRPRFLCQTGCAPQCFQPDRKLLRTMKPRLDNLQDIARHRPPDLQHLCQTPECQAWPLPIMERSRGRQVSLFTLCQSRSPEEQGQTHPVSRKHGCCVLIHETDLSRSK
jgi:hypothetical protein